jgi:two-component system sensor histidine kinase TctE
MTPIAATDIPADVQPLVEAVNFHVERTRRLTEAQRRVVDDATHQLRTPLTTLSTQVGFALREPDPAHLRNALHAVKLQLDETIRQTNQMLALARADSIEVASQSIELTAFAAEVTRAWWAEARAKGIDLGLDEAAEPIHALAHPELLAEALSNLLHNAIRYTPREGQVTVRVSAERDEARITVIDNGPGIPEAELPRAGERFFRASNARQPGSGLGLAIVRSIAQRYGGRLEVNRGPQDQGMAMSLVLPLAGSHPQPTG